MGHITRIGLAAVAALTGFAAQAQPTPHRVLGTVNFPVTCSPPAQADFNHGMLLQHSFWYQVAGEAFRQVRREDPGCTMAYWGEALTLLTNPYSPPSPQNIRRGRELLAEATRLGARSPREADYIAALSLIFADGAPGAAGHRARLAAYRDAIGRLSERFPDDREAFIQHALLLGVASAPTDRSYADQLRGAEMLERELMRQPEHPGIVHYLIHLYDYPALASRGVRAAERYGTLAADAPHALHMPSHIYTRIGRWEDSVESNRRSAALALSNGEADDTLHAYDYMVYAYLQTGRDAAAREAMREAEAARFDGPRRTGYAFAMAAIPARYALERGAWADAAALVPRPEPNALFTEALTHFARAIGLVRGGSPAEASADIQALERISQALASGDAYWSGQVAIQRAAAAGWQEFAAGRREEGLASLRGAAEREAGTDKHAITPGPLAPARELYAEALLEAGRPAAALVEFQGVQRTEPRRFRAIAGAARAADAAGDRDEARRQYGQLLDVAGSGGAGRPEVVAARAYLGR